MMNIPKATHTGELKIGDMLLPCSVLSDGTRILTQSDFMKGMGMYYSGWVSKHGPAELPHFLSFKSLKPYVQRHLGDLQSIVVEYRTERGSKALGVKASIIPNLCDVWIDAEENGNLGIRQKQIAKKAKVLIRALATVGIVALIDEATGYQEIRDREELQKILDKYLRADYAQWSKRFPDEFYKEIFRLRDWQWCGMKVNRPQVVGRYTKNIVWARLAPGVLAELERLNPPDNKGERKVRHHQYLTDNVGHVELQKHLNGVIVLMKSVTHHDPNKAWNEFQRRLQRVYPMVNTNLDLPFDDDA